MTSQHIADSKLIYTRYDVPCIVMCHVLLWQSGTLYSHVLLLLWQCTTCLTHSNTCKYDVPDTRRTRREEDALRARQAHRWRVCKENRHIYRAEPLQHLPQQYCNTQCNTHCGKGKRTEKKCIYTLAATILQHTLQHALQHALRETKTQREEAHP